MRMKSIFTLFFLSCVLQLSAQDFSTSWLKEAAPRNIGPGGMSGRITSIDVVNSDPDVMYVGTASGGLWKSTSGGVTWEPIFNDQVTAFCWCSCNSAIQPRCDLGRNG